MPAFDLHRVDEVLPLDTVLGDFDRLVAENEHFEFFTFPYTDSAITIRRNRTGEPLAPQSKLALFFDAKILQPVIANALFSIAARRNSLIPRLNRILAPLVAEGDYVDHSYRVFTSERTIRFTEMEWALPREHGPEFVRRVLAWIHTNRFPTNFPLECRVVAGDDALLSPAHERATMYVAVHQYRGMEWRPYFEAVEAIAGEYGGRPHWGKRHHLTHEVLAERYPRFGDFLQSATDSTPIASLPTTTRDAASVTDMTDPVLLDAAQAALRLDEVSRSPRCLPCCPSYRPHSAPDWRRSAISMGRSCLGEPISTRRGRRESRSREHRLATGTGGRDGRGRNNARGGDRDRTRPHRARGRRGQLDAGRLRRRGRAPARGRTPRTALRNPTDDQGHVRAAVARRLQRHATPDPSAVGLRRLPPAAGRRSDHHRRRQPARTRLGYHRCGLRLWRPSQPVGICSAAPVVVRWVSRRSQRRFRRRIAGLGIGGWRASPPPVVG